MTSPNPMALEAKALDPAHEIQLRIARAIFDPGATEGYKGDRTLSQWQADAVMRVINLAVLPPPAAGEGLEPVAWTSAWAYQSLLNGQLIDAVLRPKRDATFQVPLYAATPTARAAVLPSADASEIAKLVAFFNEPAAYAKWGKDGDHDFLSPADTAINALRAALKEEKT